MLFNGMYLDDMVGFDKIYLKSKSFTVGFTKRQNLQRLGGLMSMTDKVGFSMSLPLLLIRLSSYSGVKTLLPLLVLSEWSVGLKLTGDRKLFPWVLLALGKVLRPSMIYTEHERYTTKKYCNAKCARKYFMNSTLSHLNLPQRRIGCNHHEIYWFNFPPRRKQTFITDVYKD